MSINLPSFILCSFSYSHLGGLEKPVLLIISNSNAECLSSPNSLYCTLFTNLHPLSFYLLNKLSINISSFSFSYLEGLITLSSYFYVFLEMIF